LEYNLHWTVLNAKDFGLPQNRERVFLVGIRPDLPNTFRFPIGWNLDLRLKDVLESNVDEKYYLSDKMLGWLQSHSDKSQDKGNGFKFQVKDVNSTANAINARTFKMGVDDNYVSDPIPVRMVGRNPDNPKSRKTGEYREQTIERYEEGIFGTLTTVQKDNLILVGGIKEGLFQEGGKTEDYPQAFRVYDEEGLSSTLSACGGGMGGKTGLYQVKEVKKDDSKIQNWYNEENKVMEVGDVIQTGQTNMKGQRIYKTGISPTLPAENPRIVTIINEVKQINPSKESNGVQPYQQNRVYDSEGIMPALTSELSGRNNVQVIVKEGTKKGYAIAQEGDSINLQYPESNTRKGRVGKQIAQTIDTGSNQYVVQKRIRRLTPRECFRLQGFPDYFDISHVSETQAYKQAGNSIPVSVLKEIFKNLTPILQ
jgi:site-specific DNA-cytosine methylase